MIAYLLRRLIQTFPVLFSVVLLVFLSLHLAPGDPVDFIVGPDTPFNMDRDAYVAEIRGRLGLDKPLPQQFASYLGGLARLDLGRSLRTDRPILDELLPRYGVTIELATFAFLLTLLIGIPLGVVSAIRPNSWLDSIVTTTGSVGVSLPSFWLGLLLMLFFSLKLGWLPPSGRPASAFTAEGIRFLILPGLTLALGAAALVMRLTRSQLLEVLSEDFVRTAREGASRADRNPRPRISQRRDPGCYGDGPAIRWPACGYGCG